MRCLDGDFYKPVACTTTTGVGKKLEGGAMAGRAAARGTGVSRWGGDFFVPEILDALDNLDVLEMF